MPVTDAERLNCNNSALNCFGTAYIFECRVQPLKIATKVLTFSSFLGPMAVGLTVMSVGTTGQLVGWIIVVALILSCIQIVVSLWALVSEWQNRLAFCEGSMVENNVLSSDFTDLANNTLLSDSDWRNRAAVLDQKGEYRKREDLRQSVTEEERRMGMRYALRYFQRPCSGCRQVPTTIEASDCSICGSFKIRSFKWLM